MPVRITGRRCVLLLVTARAATAWLCPPSLLFADGHGAEGNGKAPSLMDLMDEIGDLHRGLRRSVKDADSAKEAVPDVRRMQRLAARSMMLVPAMAADLPASERPAFHLAYKREMVRLISGLLDLEEAMMAGKVEEAKTIYKGLGKIKAAGHKQFQREEE